MSAGSTGRAGIPPPGSGSPGGGGPTATAVDAPGKSRVIGVDVARGVALLGMAATHVFDAIDDYDRPTAAAMVSSGRSAATFALLAGVSVAFLSGGRQILRGRARTAAAAALAVRAAAIGALGLLLGLLNSAHVILPFYAAMFLLAIPLLRLSPKALAAFSAGFVLLGPVLLVVTARLGLSYEDRGNPTFATLISDPVGLLRELFLTGSYPLVVYLAFLYAGLAIGRLDLTSRRVAGWLLGGGLALAVTARVVSLLLLYPLGGLDRLLGQVGDAEDRAEAAAELLWNADQGSSWWFLAVPAPHSHSTVDAAHVLGSAMAVLGAVLLLTRIRAVRRLLGPLAAAGAMTLTLYSLQLVALDTGLLEDDQTAQYLLLVLPALGFALLWRRWRGQGPLERAVSAVSTRARRAVLAGAAQSSPSRAPVEVCRSGPSPPA
jgi:uncharacterized membrane protein YeiB